MDSQTITAINGPADGLTFCVSKETETLLVPIPRLIEHWGNGEFLQQDTLFNVGRYQRLTGTNIFAYKGLDNG